MSNILKERFFLIFISFLFILKLYASGNITKYYEGEEVDKFEPVKEQIIIDKDNSEFKSNNFIHFLPDLSRIKLKDFSLNALSPIKKVLIKIDSEGIEPELELTFDESGKLTRFRDDFDGYYLTYTFLYNEVNKPVSIHAEYYCDRDDDEDKTHYLINYQIIWKEGIIDRIKESAVDDKGNLLSDVSYKVAYDSDGNVERIRDENNPEIFWNKRIGYFDPDLNYDMDEETRRGERIWDSSLDHYYVNVSKKDLEYSFDPYLNWYNISFEEGEYPYKNTYKIKINIEYFNNYYGTLRGVLDYDKTSLEDFFYDKNSGIIRIILDTNSAETGIGYEYEFYPDGKVKYKSFFDKLDEVIIDKTTYTYDTSGRIKTTVNRFMNGYLTCTMGDREIGNSQDFYITKPVVETLTNFIWDDKRLTGITEKILSINNQKVNYPEINYSVKQFPNGKISEITCIDFPEIKMTFTPEGFIKCHTGYEWDYTPESESEIGNSDCFYRQEKINSCDFEVIYIPDIDLKYSRILKNMKNQRSGIEDSKNRPTKPLWDYRLPSRYGDVVVKETDLKGNWTWIEWDCEWPYECGIEAEIEYFDEGKNSMELPGFDLSVFMSPAYSHESWKLNTTYTDNRLLELGFKKHEKIKTEEGEDEWPDTYYKMYETPYILDKGNSTIKVILQLYEQYDNSNPSRMTLNGTEDRWSIQFSDKNDLRSFVETLELSGFNNEPGTDYYYFYDKDGNWCGGDFWIVEGNKIRIDNEH